MGFRNKIDKSLFRIKDSELLKWKYNFNPVVVKFLVENTLYHDQFKWQLPSRRQQCVALTGGRGFQEHSPRLSSYIQVKNGWKKETNIKEANKLHLLARMGALYAPITMYTPYALRDHVALWAYRSITPLYTPFTIGYGYGTDLYTHELH